MRQLMSKPKDGTNEDHSDQPIGRGPRRGENLRDRSFKVSEDD